ncbi:MAG: hypothetical protein LBH34_04310 [Prevotellaceae bacterium]|nr:hypothetical protein [Prevotellaceae bacterium]
MPYGLKEGTNPDNFQANRGGWNCQHQLIPVPDSAVPNELRSKFKKKRYTDKELEQIKKKEKDTLNYGRENIIGRLEFNHPAFNGTPAKFIRNSFKENLRYGEVFNDKVDILRNIEQVLSGASYNKFVENVKIIQKPNVEGYFIFNGMYKNNNVEYLFEKRVDGTIVFHFIKLHKKQPD